MLLSTNIEKTAEKLTITKRYKMPSSGRSAPAAKIVKDEVKEATKELEKDSSGRSAPAEKIVKEEVKEATKEPEIDRSSSKFSDDDSKNVSEKIAEIEKKKKIAEEKKKKIRAAVERSEAMAEKKKVFKMEDGMRVIEITHTITMKPRCNPLEETSVEMEDNK